MKTLFLINPAAGGRQGSKLAKELTRLIETSIIDAELHLLNSPSLPPIALEKQFECIVIAGGDGTVATLLPQLRSTTAKLAIYPLGTGNDLAEELSFAKVWRLGISEALRAIQSSPEREIHCWKVYDATSGKPLVTFFNYLSIGFSAQVVGHFEQNRSVWNRFGRWGNRLGYFLIALKNLFSFSLSELNVADQTSLAQGGKPSIVSKRNASCLLFPNVSSIMGLGKKTTSAAPLSDQLSAVQVTSFWCYLAMLLAKFWPNRFQKITGLELGTSRHWRVSGLSSGDQIQVDGENRRVITTSLEIKLDTPVSHVADLQADKPS